MTENGYKRPTLGAPTTDERPEVEMWGRVFHVRPLTRSVQRSLAEAEDAIAAADGVDAEMAVVAGRFDALLAPANGQRTPASKLLLEEWNADRLDVGALTRFFEQVLELVARPT